MSDFSDKRVFVVGTADQRVARHHEANYLGVEQTFDGPTFVVVGPSVSDEKLRRNIDSLASRFDVTLEQLRAAADGQAEVHHA